MYDISENTATTEDNVDVESNLDETDIIKISKDDVETEIIPMEINPLENGDVDAD